MGKHRGKGRPRHRYHYEPSVREWRCYICGKKQERFDTHIWAEAKP